MSVRTNCLIMACSPADFAASLKGAGVKPKGTLVIAAADGSIVKVCVSQRSHCRHLRTLSLSHKALSPPNKQGTGDLDGANGIKVAATIYSMLQVRSLVLFQSFGKSRSQPVASCPADPVPLIFSRRMRQDSLAPPAKRLYKSCQVCLRALCHSACH